MDIPEHLMFKVSRFEIEKRNQPDKKTASKFQEIRTLDEKLKIAVRENRAENINARFYKNVK
jgi:hypothetical protein